MEEIISTFLSYRWKISFDNHLIQPEANLYINILYLYIKFMYQDFRHIYNYFQNMISCLSP